MKMLNHQLTFTTSRIRVEAKEALALMKQTRSKLSSKKPSF